MIYFDDNGSWQEPIPVEVSDVLAFKPLNGFVDIQTNNYAYD